MTAILDKLMGLFSNAETSITSAGDYLPILRGTADTHGSKGWKRITFSQGFASPPQVMITGSPGLSDYQPRQVKFATITIPDVNIPIINVELPNVNLPDLSQFLIDQVNSTAWSNTGNPLVDALSNTTRAPIIAILLIFCYYVGQAFDKFADEYIQPLLNNIVDTLNTIKDNINNDIIGFPDNPKSGTINSALDNIRTETETVINQISSTVEYTVNHIIDYAFEFVGVIDAIPLAPTATRNVSNTSFEFYSAGGVYSWMAIGVFQT